jgi:formiminoglutamase
MALYQSLTDFLTPIALDQISADEGYRDGQIGKHIALYHDEFPDLDATDVVIVGCGEERGAGNKQISNQSPDAVRRALYQLYYWHTDIRLADVGNLKHGAALNDSYAALKTVIAELTESGKTVIVIGGSHDLTLAQYRAVAARAQIIEATVVDAKIDLDTESVHAADQFLMELLTSEPNFLNHYNHIGFQSYLLHPSMLETLDKLRFDCYRVGKVKENIEEMEPVIRNSEIFSFDISSIANAFAPANRLTANGFDGEQACALMRYAGLSPHLQSIGIYGYNAAQDRDELTAKQISNMLWYFLDGRSRGKNEASLQDRESFNEYHIAFAEIGTVFLQSKKTGRWWMQLPDKKFIACSYKDYMSASANEIPERWLRAQERS